MLAGRLDKFKIANLCDAALLSLAVSNIARKLMAGPVTSDHG
jgi:hypothetical protein